MHKLTVYQHIYKNGGTSVRQGFLYSPHHRMLIQRDDVIYVYDYDRQLTHPLTVQEMERQDNPKFFTGSVDAYTLRNQLDITRKHVQYIITLRDPIARLMSAYNYYNFHLKTNQQASDPNFVMDFNIWFDNKHQLYPDWKPQYLDIIQKKFAVLTVEDSIYLATNNTHLIDHNKYLTQALEQIDLWQPTILTTSQDYITEVERLAGLTHAPGLRHQNVTDDLISNTLKFNDLNPIQQDRVQQELSYEVRFYEQCIS